MSVRYALLGLLAEAPMSGYDLTKRFEHSLGAIWPARHNQIYMELKKLLEAGLIAQIEYGARNRKLYAATGTGTAELKRWLMAELEPADRALRFEPPLRANFLWLLEADEADAFLAREEAFFRARRDWLAEQAQTLPTEDADGSVEARRRIAAVGLSLFGDLADWLTAYRRALRDEGGNGDSAASVATNSTPHQPDA